MPSQSKSQSKSTKTNNQMSTEPNIISLEHFPTKRGVLLNKQLYDAAFMAKHLKAGRTNIPHSRTKLTANQYQEIMEKTGKVYHRTSLPRNDYTAYEKLQKVRRVSLPKDVQARQVLTLAQKLRKTIYSKLMKCESTPILGNKIHFIRNAIRYRRLQFALRTARKLSPDAIDDILNEMYNEKLSRDEGSVERLNGSKPSYLTGLFNYFDFRDTDDTSHLYYSSNVLHQQLLVLLQKLRKIIDTMLMRWVTAIEKKAKKNVFFFVRKSYVRKLQLAIRDVKAFTPGRLDSVLDTVYLRFSN